MAVFSHADFADHEGVYFASDPESNLRAIIAVHSTVRGPAAGGTRFWRYDSDEAALTDALRLSKAMSYKNAAADLPLGGGKAVLIYPEGEFNRVSLFEAYGRAIDRLNGTYITAEDVGVSPSDMDVISSQTKYVAGLSQGKAASGDPSPVTAEGIFRGLMAGVKYVWNDENISGKSVAVQGLGHVGWALAEKLYKNGAKLIVADINNDVLDKAETAFNASRVDIGEIHAQDVDIFCPCALGGVLNAQNVPDIQARLIAGAANNQLASEEVMPLLEKRDITYLPDFVLNAGGIINVAAEVSGEYSPAWIEQKLVGLKETISEILQTSEREGVSTLQVANRIAEQRLKRD